MKKIFGFVQDSGTKKPSLMIAVFLQIAVSILSLSISEVLRQGINAIEYQSINLLWYSAILGLFSTVFLIVGDALLKVKRIKLQSKAEQALQASLLNKIVDIKKIRLEKISVGEVITILMSSASKGIQDSLGSIFSFSGGLSTIILGIGYMFYVEWRLAICMVLYVSILRFVISKAQISLRENSKKIIDVTKKNNMFLVDLLKNMITVRVFEKNSFFKKRFYQNEEKGLKATMKKNIFFNGIADGTWAFVKLSEFIIIYGIGGLLVYQKITTIGTLIAFTFAVDILMKGIDSLVRAISYKNSAFAHIEAVDEILQITELEEEPLAIIEKKSFAVTAKNISFGYGEEYVLENVSFTIAKGEKVLIQGPNGKGKSTLLKLISGLYRPDSGEILFGEANTSSIHLKSLSEIYGYISQNSNILSGNLKENIALNNIYNSSRMDNTIEQLGLVESIDTEPTALSQGEKQRLNIGRSLYKQDTFLILGDEVFANIDAVNALHITKLMNELFKDKTIIFVSHEKMEIPFHRVLTVDNKAVMQEVLL